VENNAPNIVAAMLVSPLMGPVMSITFGAIISDKELMVSAAFPYGSGFFCRTNKLCGSLSLCKMPFKKAKQHCGEKWHSGK